MTELTNRKRKDDNLMNINEIKQHLYKDNTDEAINYINAISDEETLYTYAK